MRKHAEYLNLIQKKLLSINIATTKNLKTQKSAALCKKSSTGDDGNMGLDARTARSRREDAHGDTFALAALFVAHFLAVLEQRGNLLVFEPFLRGAQRV